MSWSDWDEKNRAEIKPEVEEKEEFPTCEICGETFLHINTLKIHKKRNCLEEKPEPVKLRFRKPEIVSLKKSKSTKHKTLEKPEVEEKEEFPTCKICGETFLHINTLTIHQQQNCLEKKPEPPKENNKKPEIVSLRMSKSATHKTFEEPEVKEKEELIFEGPTLIIHKRQNCLDENPEPPKLEFKKPDIGQILKTFESPKTTGKSLADIELLKKSKSMKCKVRKISNKVPLLPEELALDTEIQRSIANRNKVQVHRMFPRILKIMFYPLDIVKSITLH